MHIKRNTYLDQLIEKRMNGQIKIITGIRRCGKSYLLFNIYSKYLQENKINKSQILKISLDTASSAQYRNPIELNNHIKSFINKNRNKESYIFLDEIQFVQDVPNPWLPKSSDKIGFVDVCLGLKDIENVDIYVTGSNSRMLSTDVVTQFRGKGDLISLAPLSYKEFCEFKGGDSEKNWQSYCTYGGLPKISYLKSRKDKIQYLEQLFSNLYTKDIIERYNIHNKDSVIKDLALIIASSVGSLTNPKKIADTFNTKLNININSSTITNYCKYLKESFLIEEARRYDIKGRKYLGSPLKYYFSDIGIRNAILGFRQQEQNHIMENIIFNELNIRGYSISVGNVAIRKITNDSKYIRKNLEVDFVVEGEGEKFYIQSALNIYNQDKLMQESRSLMQIKDNYRKYIIVGDPIEKWTDNNGIVYVGIREFLTSIL